MYNFALNELSKLFSVSEHNSLSVDTIKHKFTEDLVVISVKNDQYTKKFYLVKTASDSASVSDHTDHDSPLLSPRFIVQDKSKQHFFVLPEEHLLDAISPRQNNLQHIKIVLESLVKYQIKSLSSSPDLSHLNKVNVTKTFKSLLGTNVFNELDQNKVIHDLNKLQQSIDTIDSNLLVRSIGGHEESNIFIKEAVNEAIFLDIEPAELISPIQDGLWVIFVLTTEKFRQEHFQELISFYFGKFTDDLHKTNSDLADKFTTDYCEYLVRTLLPVVKLSIANVSDLQTPQELFPNILNFFKNPLLNQEDIYEVLHNKLNTNKYELIDYNLRPLSEVNGHLGQYYHLDIKVNLQGESIEITLFAKFIIPPTETMGLFVKNGPASREHFFYHVLLPLYRETGLESLLDFAPKCYLSQIGWLMVLDDVTADGYVTLKPNNLLEYHALSAVVEKLAKFHASSIIYEEIMSKKLEKRYLITEHFKSIFDTSSYIYSDQNPLKGVFDASIAAIKYIFGFFPDIKDSFNLSQADIEAFIDDTFENNHTNVLPSEKYRNAINHGDMYIGNVLLKLNRDNIVTKAKLVDFQMLRYCPPTSDLVFWLYVNSSKDTRKRHLNQLTEEYYQHIANNLREFGFDPEDIYPKDNYEDSLKYVKVIAIMLSIQYNHVIKIDPEFREELFHDQEKFNYYMHMNRKELIDMNISKEEYKAILKGLLEDLAELIANK